MIKVIKNKEFNRKTSAFFMPSGCGPCRFGQYNVFQKMVLNELGFDDIPIYCPNQNERFYDELARTSGKNFSRLAWRGIVAVDVMEKMLRKIRPYEINKGESERVFKDYLETIYATIIKEKNIDNVIKEARESFEKIEIDKNKKLPVVGIVGEIFIRNHSFSNNNLIKTLEELGAEVKLPPSSEWLLYQSFLAKRRTWQKKKYINYAKNFIRAKIQKLDYHKSEKILKGFLLDYHEPETSEILKYSSPYLSPLFEGEAILSVGKAIDFYLKGVSGIVVVMPFTCMPGTITSSILNCVRSDYGDVPLLNIAYDGMEETNIRTRLEAFTYQAEQYRKQSANIQDKEENRIKGNRNYAKNHCHLWTYL
jgi:predicted nucleotide-binding protein (sugar kinase/HSP70/actin superfamily)